MRIIWIITGILLVIFLLIDIAIIHVNKGTKEEEVISFYTQESYKAGTSCACTACSGKPDKAMPTEKERTCLNAE